RPPRPSAPSRPTWPSWLAERVGPAVPGCELCAARPLTPWFHTDDRCWVAECLICRTPMVVWRRHGPDPPAPDRDHMLARLAEVAAAPPPPPPARAIGGAARPGAPPPRLDGAFRIDPVMRRIPDHFHAHARDPAWPGFAWSQLGVPRRHPGGGQRPPPSKGRWVPGSRDQ